MIKTTTPNSDPGGVAEFWFGPRTPRAMTRAALGLAPEKIVIVTVASLMRRKGHGIVLAALTKLRAPLRERLTWLIIGAEGEHGYIAELKSAISASACDAHLLGSMRTQQICDIYGAADLFCLIDITVPLGSFEERGSVYLEAAASGLPSVATPGSAGGVVVDNETGCLVAPSASGVARAIAELAMDGIKRVSLGKRAWTNARSMGRSHRIALSRPPSPNEAALIRHRDASACIAEGGTK